MFSRIPVVWINTSAAVSNVLFMLYIVLCQLAQAEGRVILTCGQPFQSVRTTRAQAKVFKLIIIVHFMYFLCILYVFGHIH